MWRLVLEGIFACAGQWQDRFVTVENHIPPPWLSVPVHFAKFCDCANSIERDPRFASAYVLWRLGWIHPFYDGNGRGARELSYRALVVGRGVSEFPGTPTIPERIDQKYRDEYFSGLYEANRAWDGDTVNVQKLESLISGLFVERVASVTPEFLDDQ